MNPPNIETATAQEVFDFVISNLLKQFRKSKTDTSGICLYRGPNGLKCAAGWLIPDDKYEKRFEGKSWFKVTRMLKGSDNHASLIRSLQRIHDHNDPIEWISQFKILADQLSLKWNH